MGERAIRAPCLPLLDSVGPLVSVEIDRDSIMLARTGPGLSMQIQAKKCAAGSVFQIDVERGEAFATGPASSPPR